MARQRQMRVSTLPDPILPYKPHHTHGANEYQFPICIGSKQEFNGNQAKNLESRNLESGKKLGKNQ